MKFRSWFTGRKKDTTTAKMADKPHCLACGKRLHGRFYTCPQCGQHSHANEKCSQASKSDKKHKNFQWFCRADCLETHTRATSNQPYSPRRASATQQLYIGYIEIGNLVKQKYTIWKLLAIEQYDALLLINTKVGAQKFEEERLKFPGYVFYQNYQRSMGIYARMDLEPRKMEYTDVNNTSFDVLVVSLAARGGATLTLLHRPSHAVDHHEFSEHLTDFLMRVLWSTTVPTNAVNRAVSAQKLLLVGHFNICPLTEQKICQNEKTTRKTKYTKYLSAIERRFQLKQVIRRDNAKLGKGTLMFLGNQLRVDREGYDILGDKDCPTCKELPILWTIAGLRPRYYGSFASLAMMRSTSLPPDRSMHSIGRVTAAATSPPLEVAAEQDGIVNGTLESRGRQSSVQYGTLASRHRSQQATYTDRYVVPAYYSTVTSNQYDTYQSNRIPGEEISDARLYREINRDIHSPGSTEDAINDYDDDERDVTLVQEPPCVKIDKAEELDGLMSYQLRSTRSQQMHSNTTTLDSRRAHFTPLGRSNDTSRATQTPNQSTLDVSAEPMNQTQLQPLLHQINLQLEKMNRRNAELDEIDTTYVYPLTAPGSTIKSSPNYFDRSERTETTITQQVTASHQDLRESDARYATLEVTAERSKQAEIVTRTLPESQKSTTLERISANTLPANRFGTLSSIKETARESNGETQRPPIDSSDKENDKKGDKKNKKNKKQPKRSQSNVDVTQDKSRSVELTAVQSQTLPRPVRWRGEENGEHRNKRRAISVSRTMSRLSESQLSS